MAKVKDSADKVSRPQKGKRYPRVDPYRVASDAFIEAMETGHAPWDREHALLPPRNAVTGRQYSGINFSSLMATPHQDARWCSFNQAKAQGWGIPKGIKASRIYLYKQLDILPKEGEEQLQQDKDAAMEVKQVPYLESFCVFNLEQLEGVPPDTQLPQPQDLDVDAVLDSLRVVLDFNDAEDALEKGPQLTERGLLVPHPERFESVKAYESCVMQGVAMFIVANAEHTQSFDPQLSKLSPGMRDVMLRLRAQMASVMMSSEYGLPVTRIATAEDIALWKEMMLSDKKAVFSASRDAWRICDVVANNAPLPAFMLDSAPTTNLAPEDMDALFGDAQLVPDKRPRPVTP